MNLAKLTALIAAAASLNGCREESDTTPSGVTVRIGVIASLSGDDEATGRSGLMGVEIVRELHPMLDNGDKIRLVIEDDGSAPAGATSALARLAAGNVTAVLLLTQSNTAMALTDEASRHGLPIIATIATHSDLTVANPRLIQIPIDDTFQGTVAALYVRDELLLNRAAVFSDAGDIHSELLAGEFARRFRKAGGTVLGEFALDTPDGAVPQETLVALRDRDVELVYVPVSTRTFTRLSDQLSRIDWRPRLMGADGLVAETVLKHEENLAMLEGVLVTDVYSAALKRTLYGRRIFEFYQDKYGKGGASYSVLACEGTSILFEAMNACERPYESEPLDAALREIRGFEGYSGPLSIGQDGRADRAVYVNTVRNGKLQHVVKVY